MQHVNGEINQNTLKSSPQSSWKEALAGTTVFTFVRKKMMLGQYTLWQIQNNYKPIKLEIHAHFSLFNIFQPSNVIIHYFCIWIKQQPTWNEKHDQKYYTHKIYIYIYRNNWSCKYQKHWIFTYWPINGEVPLQTIPPTNIILLIAVNGTLNIIAHIPIELSSSGAKTWNL